MRTGLHAGVRVLPGVRVLLSVVLSMALCGRANTTEQCPERSSTSSPVAAQPAQIREAVEGLLAEHVLLRTDDVDVSVDAGTVILSGAVSSLLTRRRAADVAAEVRGVASVRNEIVVHPYARRNPDDIESSIIQALTVSPATESFQVDVEAEPDGSVLLTGTVDSRAERELTQRVAESVLGVTGVENRLRVRHGRMRLDSEIAAEIERALQWNTSIDDSRINVAVRDGIVTLSGWVDSAGEKARATKLAWTAGTRDVNAGKLNVDARVQCTNNQLRSEA